MTQTLIAAPLHGEPESNEDVWFGHAKRPAFTAAAAVASVCSLDVPAHAHGFGQRYDLPLPLSLYLFGTAAAVVLSFVIVGLFARHAPGASGYPRVDLLARPLYRQIARALGTFLKLFSISLLVLTVIAGFYGSQNPYQNIAPTLVWIIWWVGLAVFSAFFGDLWVLINPWRAVFDWADRLYRTGGGRGLGLHWPYPEALAVWPAFTLLLAVSWTELVFASPAMPANIAGLALFYSLLTWTGMAAFGSEAWLKHGEVFSVFFGVFARFAPTEPIVRDLSGEHGLALTN
jgi:hypothetical protein